jgi:alpha-methylacyl-CoA racemase
MMLAMGILAGVISSSKTGKGQVIDSAMIDGSLSLMSFFYSLKEMGVWKDERKSNFLDGAAHFYDTYKCLDNKYIAIGSIEPQFYEILLDKLELTNPKFKQQMDKSIWKELKEIIASKIKSQPRDHWVEVFSGTDGCVTPVLNMDEVQEHEHIKSRDSFINLEGFNQPAPAPRFSNDMLSIKHNARVIGSDIDNVCKEFNLDKKAFS